MDCTTSALNAGFYTALFLSTAPYSLISPVTYNLGLNPIKIPHLPPSWLYCRRVCLPYKCLSLCKQAAPLIFWGAVTWLLVTSIGTRWSKGAFIPYRLSSPCDEVPGHGYFKKSLKLYVSQALSLSLSLAGEKQAYRYGFRNKNMNCKEATGPETYSRTQLCSPYLNLCWHFEIELH